MYTSSYIVCQELPVSAGQGWRAAGRHGSQPGRAGTSAGASCATSSDSSDGGWARPGEADVQDEMPEPEVEYSAVGPVHEECQQHDGQDYDDHPEEEHDDAGDGIPGYSSRSSHGHQLPTAARPIRRVFRQGWPLIGRAGSRPAGPGVGSRRRSPRSPALDEVRPEDDLPTIAAVTRA